MCLSFYDLGHAKAEQDIDSHESNPFSSLSSEIKGFTTKVPAHVLESIDFIASSLNMNRNAFVSKLIELYLPAAFSDYSIGYGRAFNQSEKTDLDLVLTDLDEYLDRSVAQGDLSEAAETYLKKLIVGYLTKEGA